MAATIAEYIVEQLLSVINVAPISAVPSSTHPLNEHKSTILATTVKAVNKAPLVSGSRAVIRVDAERRRYVNAIVVITSYDVELASKLV